MSYRSLLLSLVLGSTALVANEYVYDDAYDSCCCEDQPRFLVRGEYLIFQTTWDQPHYVLSATDNFFDGEHYPLANRHINNPPFKSGFRVEAAYLMPECPTDLDLRFTWLQSSHTTTFAGPVLWVTKGFPGDGAQSGEDTPFDGVVQDSFNIHYYGGDFTFNRIHPGCCGENLTFLVGLHFAYIKFKEDHLSTGSYSTDDGFATVSNNLRNTSRFWGIGPQFGVDYRHDFFSHGDGSLTFVANARAALLASNTKACLNDVTTRTGPLGLSIKNDTYWRVTPAFDARLGFSSSFDCFCLAGTVEFGYEMLYYSNVIDTILGYDVAYAGDTIDLYSNLNAQGPYVAINLAF